MTVPFGGVHLIFSGDFFQLVPVSGSSLYQLISTMTKQSNSEIAKWLGRIAWKTVDTVVQLHEQKQMENDISYSAALNRLRHRKCTLEDMDLFNSCCIKSTSNPEGVDMGVPENIDAIAIVPTNLLRQGINNKKANIIKNYPDGPELVVCAAHDTASSKTLEESHRSNVL